MNYCNCESDKSEFLTDLKNHKIIMLIFFNGLLFNVTRVRDVTNTNSDYSD